MTESNGQQPREWFRLQGKSMGQTKPGMQPIEQPVNHDGLDLSQLPPMREATLSQDELRQLFNDIEALADEVLLMQRNRPAARATAAVAATAAQLHTARDALLAASIARLQIRYKWRGQAWIDTLEARGAQFRLVRIRHQLPV